MIIESSKSIMKTIQRVYLSIIGKPVKSLLLLFVTFLLGTFIATSFSVYQAANGLQEYVKSSLSPIVKIQRSDNLYEFDGEKMVWKYSKEEEDEIVQLINSMRKDSRIKDSQFRYSSDLHMEIPNRLYSIDEINFADIKEESLILGEGRMFTQEDIDQGNNVIVIVKNPHYLNNPPYNVGDKISVQMKNIYNENEILYDGELEVIGILYTDDNEFTAAISNIDGDALQGRPYIPLNTLKKIGNLKDQAFEKSLYQSSSTVLPHVNFPNNYIVNGYYRLNSIDDLESFLKDFKSELKKYPDFEITSEQDSYNDVKGPTTNLASIAIVVLVLAIIATVIITALILQIFVKEKQREVGLYLSLGETKNNMFKQIILEVLIISSLGILLSGISGHLLGNRLSNQMLSQIVTSEETNQESTIPNDYIPNLSMEYVGVVLGSGALILSIESFVIVRKIMKMKPKEMLQ